MRQLGLGVSLALAAVVGGSLAGCGGGGSGETYLVVRVERGTTQGDIDKIQLQFALGDKMDMVDLVEANSAPIALPTTKVVRLRSGEGGITVTAIASLLGAEKARGSASATIVSGENNDITVTLGVNATTDGGMPDGAVAALTLDKTSHDFGIVIKGMTSAPATFTVSNSGGAATGALTASLGGSDAGMFAIAADTCSGMTLAPAATCTVQVTVTPTAANAQAMLTIAGNPGGTATAVLSGMGVDPGALTITPTMQNFGSVVMGGQSSTTTFTVANTGGAATGNVTATLTGTDAAQFSVSSDACTGQALAGGQTCTVTVRFAPTATGAKTAQLTVTATPGGNAVATLMGSGLQPGALQINPMTGAFGSVLQGAQSATQSFTVTNTGGATTGNVAVSLTAANASEFMIVTDGCNGMTLTGGGSCTISVRMVPTSAGAKVATLLATATPGGSAAAALSGTGLAPAGMSIMPAMQDFSTVVIGSNASATFTVQNTGGVATTVPSSALSGTSASEFMIMTNGCTAALPPAGTCMITVRFQPTTMGAKTARLTVTAATGGSAFTDLMGSAVTPGALQIAPMTHNFLGVVVGGMSGTQAFTITNTGGAATGMLSTMLTGTALTQYRVTADTCMNQSLAASGTCMVTVRFEPTSTGAKTASLQVMGNPGGLASASLQGDGLAPAQLGVSPTSHTFTSTVVGQQSATQSFTVSNSGGVATGVPAVSIGGMHTGDFAVVSNGCTAVIAPGGMCTITVRFQPTTTGARAAALNITASPGGSAAATLDGTGQTAAALSASTASLAFGSVATGKSSGVMSFTLSNTGQQTTGALSIASTNAEFAVQTGMAGDCGTGTLTGGANCTVRIVFSPSATGARSGALNFSATPGSSGSVNLSGTGITPANLSLSPTSFAFGGTPIGTPLDTTIVVTNSGQEAAPSLTTAIATTLPATNQFSILTGMGTDCVAGSMLAGGSTCNVRVRYLASTRGAVAGTLTVGATGVTSRNATFTGTGQLQATLSASPAGPTDFGDRETSTTSPTQTWTITNSGDLPSAAAPTYNNSNATDFPTTNNCSAVLAAGAMCTVTYAFSPSTGGVRNGTLTMTLPTGSVTLNVTGRGMYRLTVTRDFLGGTCAAGEVCRIVSTNAGQTIACDGTGACTDLFVPGTAITLRATVTNGSGRFFSGWTAGPCTGPFRDCSVTMSGPLTVTGRFSVLTDKSLMFMTATADISKTLGAVENYDAICNARAQAAGLTSTDPPAAGSGWFALLSGLNAAGAQSDFTTRLDSGLPGPSANFVRMDGRVVAPTKAALFTPSITNPIAFDENGGFTVTTYITGTSQTGVRGGNHCLNWSSAANPNKHGFGWNTGGPGGLTLDAQGGCEFQSTTARLACVRRGGSGSTVEPTASNPLRIWVTNAAYRTGNPSPDGTPDAFCGTQTHPAIPGGHSIKALVATTTRTRGSLIDPNATYVRADNVIIGTGQQILSGTFTGGMWATGDGILMTTAQLNWSGAFSLTAVGTADSTCNDYTSTSATFPPFPTLGKIYSGAAEWSGGSSASCNSTTIRMLCIETVP